MEPTAETVGRKINEALRARGHSPERLAADLGISFSTMNRYLRGETEPTYRQVVRIAQLLDRPLEWFVGEGVAA